MECKKCGYQNAEGKSSCVNCGGKLAGVNPFEFSLGQEKTVSYYNCKSCGYTLPESQKVCSKCSFDNSQNKPERKSTIPFSDFNFTKTTSGFKLIALNSDVGELAFKSDEVVLSRPDIDSHDMTISSENHVAFKKVNDRWFIDNVSSNKAVFLQVTEATEVKDGSILILGQSKVFKFEVS